MEGTLHFQLSTFNSLYAAQSANVCWPIAFNFTESIGAAGRSFAVTPTPYAPGGAFSWDAPCACGCLTCATGAPLFNCTAACTCGGACHASGQYGYEGVAFPVSGGECRCGLSDPSHPTEPIDPGPALSISFSDDAVIFEDTYQDSPGVWRPRRSTRTWLTVYANGGPTGGTLTLNQQNLDKLVPVACGPAVLPSTQTLAPYETFSREFLYEGVSPSVQTNDISVTGSLMPVGATTAISAATAITCVRVSLTPEIIVDGILNRHLFGICETVLCEWFPKTMACSISDKDSGFVSLMPSGYSSYSCGTKNAANVLAFAFGSSEYIPVTTVVPPESIFVEGAKEEPSNVAPGQAGGVEMSMSLYVRPTNVSFCGLSFMEVPSLASQVSGYFRSGDFAFAWQHDENTGAGEWHAIGTGNFFFEDHPCMNEELPRPWSDGVIVWPIPFGWGRRGDDSATNLLQQVETQSFDFNANGRLRLTKFGYWVERDADGTVRRSEGVRR